MILFKVFHCIKPLISNLQLFGRKCFVHIPEEWCLPGSKLMPWTKEGIFLGYPNTLCIYKVHILAYNHTFIMSALDIKFKSITPDSCPWVNINSGHGPIATTSILLVSPITYSMSDPHILSNYSSNYYSLSNYYNNPPNPNDHKLLLSLFHLLCLTHNAINIFT